MILVAISRKLLDNLYGYYLLYYCYYCIIFFPLFLFLTCPPPPGIQPVSAPSNFFSRFTEQGEFSKGEYGEGRLCKVGLSEEEIRGPTGLPSLPPSFFFLFSIKNRRGIPTGAFSWLGIKVRDQYRSSERKKRDTENKKKKKKNQDIKKKKRKKKKKYFISFLKKKKRNKNINIFFINFFCKWNQLSLYK